MDWCETTHLARKIRYHARVMDLTIKRLTGVGMAAAAGRKFFVAVVCVLFFCDGKGILGWVYKGLGIVGLHGEQDIKPSSSLYYHYHYYNLI